MRKRLSFSAVLLFEIVLSFFLSLFFLSWSTTGYTVQSMEKTDINLMSFYFFILGLFGFAMLLYTRRRTA